MLDTVYIHQQPSTYMPDTVYIHQQPSTYIMDTGYIHQQPSTYMLDKGYIHQKPVSSDANCKYCYSKQSGTRSSTNPDKFKSTCSKTGYKCSKCGIIYIIFISIKIQFFLQVLMIIIDSTVIFKKAALL